MKPKIRYNNRNQIIEDSEDFDRFVSENKLEVDEVETKNKKDNKIVLLTKKNADIVEKLIRDDLDYFPFAEKLFDYYGIDKIKNNTDNSLFAVLREIDRDNNTNVWRFNMNRDSFNRMTSYITDPQNKFFDKLEKGDIDLPDEIEKRGSGLKSLSSKVCKYLCEFALHKDNYYVNDSVVRRLLLFYLDYYKVYKCDKKDCDTNDYPRPDSSYKVNEMKYEELHHWLSALHKASSERHKCEITKNELDHIIWYCYKSFDCN